MKDFAQKVLTKHTKRFSSRIRLPRFLGIEGGKGMSEPSEPIELISARIARLALVVHPSLGRLGPGPVISVIRNTRTGKIYVGLNTGIPKDQVDVIRDAITHQNQRITDKEVNLVRTDPNAVGGHAEVTALNRAIADEERATGRKLGEKDLRIFELHNIWLKGERTGNAAARCEHCARITRGVAVTESIFRAEGGVLGQVTVPQRGSVTKAGSKTATPVTTTSGTITQVKPTPFGSSGSAGRHAAGGVLTAAIVLADPLISSWFAKNYLHSKWAREIKEMVENAIKAYAIYYDILIIAQSQRIQSEKNAGRAVKLRVVVDTEWVSTKYGPAQISASVVEYDVIFEGDIPIEWPVFQRSSRVTVKRDVYEIPI